MKVRYTLPAQGFLKTIGQQPIIIDNFSFYFETNKETGFVTRLTIEIKNIPEEKWPTVVTVEQDPQAKIPRFPFETNKNALRFKDIHQHITKLENILSVFGLWSIDISLMKAEWIFEEGDKHVSIFSGWEIGQKDFSCLFDPIGYNTLARCIVASGKNNRNLNAIANFRLGRIHLDNMRYVDAIRHLFFFLEYEYGNGKYKKKDLKKEFKSSYTLADYIRIALRDDNNKYIVNDIKKAGNLKNDPDENDIIDYFIDLRGELQHSNNHTFDKCNPSCDEDFEHIAYLLLSIVGNIAFDKVYDALKNVPVSQNTKQSHDKITTSE
jgi:hypothetical protein